MKIISYNINGLRAYNKLNGLEWLKSQNADIICLQEIRADEKICEDMFKEFSGYIKIYNCADKKGYAGTAMLTKIKPEKIEFGFFDENDVEGRLITLYYTKFIVMNCYVPNGAKRLEYKLEYINKLIEKAKLEKSLNSKVIICGDFNIAHTEIDVNKPKAVKKKSGFLVAERSLIDKMMGYSFIDAFRVLNPNRIQYTWRSYKSRQTSEEYGWKFRFDYIFVNKNMQKKLERCYSLDLPYSDHLPVIMEVKDETKNDL